MIGMLSMSVLDEGDVVGGPEDGRGLNARGKGMEAVGVGRVVGSGMGAFGWSTRRSGVAEEISRHASITVSNTRPTSISFLDIAVIYEGGKDGDQKERGWRADRGASLQRSFGVDGVTFRSLLLSSCRKDWAGLERS